MPLIIKIAVRANHLLRMELSPARGGRTGHGQIYNTGPATREGRSHLFLLLPLLILLLFSIWVRGSKVRNRVRAGARTKLEWLHELRAVDSRLILPSFPPFADVIRISRTSDNSSYHWPSCQPIIGEES